MFKIVRIPPKLEPFFSSLKSVFHWDHFEYFRTLVVLVAFAWGRRNVSNLYAHLDSRSRHHRTRFNNFFLVGHWEPEETLRSKAYELLLALHPQPGEIIELIIDDSKKAKRGKDMDAVGYLRDPLTGKISRGHQYVKALIRFRGYNIPWGIRLYVKEEDCPELGLEFKKTTQFAADLISEFDPPKGVKVRVVSDSYYLCPKVVKACRRKGFRFLSTLKSNRNLFKHGRKLKAGKYGRNLFRRGSKQSMSIKKGDRVVHYTYVDAGWLDVSDLGKLHVVFSRKGKEKSILGIVTDDPELSAGEMVKAYDRRWSIEVFFKDTKQLLGLGQYQNGTYRAAVIHLHLVCFAYALLTHIPTKCRGGEKGKQKQRAVELSTSRLQNELRRIVWEDLTSYLKKLPDGDSVIHELERLLIAA
jgi:SRSO17 transposase